ncbi:Polyribonucleotide nucleotidyltransferase 1, mitochondrial, partial [Armadillidium nasatum]
MRSFSVRNFFTNVACRKYQEITEFSNGRKLVLESGNIAKLADGAAIATLEETSVLVTSVSKIKPGSSSSFMPLTVDYRLKYAAAGRIPSNFLRRELAPTEKEILTSRVIASASLAISSIPWRGPVGAVRVGLIKGEVIIFPTIKELARSDLNLIITASDNNHIVMLEGSGMPVSLENLKKAIKIGVNECQKIIISIKNLAMQVQKEKKEYIPPPQPPETIVAAVKSLGMTKIHNIFTDASHDKLSRDGAVNELKLQILDMVKESYPDLDVTFYNAAFNKLVKEEFRYLILEKDIRCDGRKLNELRPISCDIDLFKPLHGSSLFQRGQTQVQCTVAFDSPDKAISKNFLLHYLFPSFANNELSQAKAVSRREIGHGALAAKGLRPILPKENPFCILLSATVMESNGIEDYLGDMDFKVAGTKDGVTALQADVKLPGIPMEIVMNSLDEGMIGIKNILSIMNKTISSPKKDKENLPVIINKEIPPHKRGALIGIGGMNMIRIQSETGVKLITESLQGEPELDFGGIYTAKIVEIRPHGVMITLYDGMPPTLLHNTQLDTKKISHPSALNLEVGHEIKVKYFGRDPASGAIRVSRRALLSVNPLAKKLFSNGES